MPSVLVVADISVLWLGLRLVASLCVILAMIAGLSWLAKRSKGLGLGLGSAKGAIVVRGREQLTRGSMVTLIEVGGRALLIGATEQSITVLAEGDDMLPAEMAVPTDDRTSSSTDPDGSVSPGMNLIEMLREWSVRRS